MALPAIKNTIPFDPASPFVTSGIRLGTPAATTRGFKEEDFKEVASIMGLVLNNPEDTDKHAEAANVLLHCALSIRYILFIIKTTDKALSASS